MFIYLIQICMLPYKYVYLPYVYLPLLFLLLHLYGIYFKITWLYFSTFCLSRLPKFHLSYATWPEIFYFYYTSWQLRIFPSLTQNLPSVQSVGWNTMSTAYSVRLTIWSEPTVWYSDTGHTDSDSAIRAICWVKHKAHCIFCTIRAMKWSSRTV